MEKAIKHMHIAESKLASLALSLTPERLGLCNEGNESGCSHTSPVPGVAFGMVPVLAPGSSTKQLLTSPQVQTKLPLAYVCMQLSPCPSVPCSSVGHAV